MENFIVKADHIYKKYGEREILRGIDLAIKKGEAVALVGENGCGKSTLLRILAGLTVPSAGTVAVKPSVRCGLIPDRYDKINLTIPRFLRHVQASEGSPCNSDAFAPYIKLFFLENMLDTPMKYLSKGTLQKIAVIQALLSPKDILFMDEPLSGQDVISQYHFAEEMRRRKEQGMAIVMACHERYLIEELADRIVQIKDGKLCDGTHYIYGNRNAGSIFLIVYKGGMPELEAQIGQVTGSLECLRISSHGNMYRVEAERKLAEPLFRLFLDRGIQIVRYEESQSIQME